MCLAPELLVEGQGDTQRLGIRGEGIVYKTALTIGLLLAVWVLPAAAVITVSTTSYSIFPDLTLTKPTQAGTYSLAGTNYWSVTSNHSPTVFVSGFVNNKTWKLYARLTNPAPTGLTVRARFDQQVSGCAVTDNGVGYQTLTTSNTSQPIFICTTSGASATASLQFQLDITPAYGNGSSTFSVTYDAIED